MFFVQWLLRLFFLLYICTHLTPGLSSRHTYVRVHFVPVHIYNEKKALSFWFFFYLLINIFFLFFSSIAHCLFFFFSVYLTISFCYSLTNNIFVRFVAMPSFRFVFFQKKFCFVRFFLFYFEYNREKQRKYPGNDIH